MNAAIPTPYAILDDSRRTADTATTWAQRASPADETPVPSGIKRDWRSAILTFTHGTGDEAARPATFPGSAREEQSGETEAERAAGDRFRLLVRKRFERKLTREERARLEIANERLRNLVPVASLDEIAQVEEAAEQVRKLAEQTARMQEQYGLR